MPTEHATMFRLGDFLVDTVSGTLTRDGDVTQLQPKVMQLLVCLVAHHGQIVSKEFLLENVWKGTFVVDGALRRCVFLLRKALHVSDEAEPMLETLPRRGYRLLLGPQPVETHDATPAAQNYAGQAYLGLRAFEQEHAAIFFGREAAVQQVVDAMDAQVTNGHGFCLILGPSGSGKSSLALAGVVPALLVRESSAADAPGITALGYRYSDSPTDPLGEFAARLIESLMGVSHLGDDKTGDEQVRALADALHTDEEAAVSTVLGLLQNDRDPPQKILLVFDQFEELLTPEVDEEVRRRLLAVLYPLIRSGHVWLIATMRSEYYPQFAAIESLRFLRGEHGQVDLTFPGAGEIADIVRRPAQLAGLEFGKDADNRQLDQIIIDDATQQANSLPLLQFALSELERKRDDNVLSVADYEALGALKGCLSSHADRTFDALPEDARAALPSVLARMIIADPRNAGRVLKRTVPVDAFEPDSGARALVEALIEARLMTTLIDKASGRPAAQFAHEAVLLNWHRGHDWVQANYADIRFRGWLDELAERWNDDARRKHYLLNDGKPLVEAQRFVASQSEVAAVTADFVKASHRRASQRDLVRGGVTLLLGALSIIALLMWRSAENSGQQAIKASQRAESVSDLLQSVFETADPGMSGDREMTALELLDQARERMGVMLESADAVDQAAILAELGETYLLMGEYDTANRLFESAEPLVPEIERAYPAVASKVLLELGGIRREQQSLDASRAYLERALALARRADDRVLVAQTLNMQGLVALSEADFEVAVDLFLRAQAELDAVDTAPAVRLRPSLFSNLGSARMQLGELDSAGDAFEQALSLRREHGLDATAAQTSALSNLGTLRRLQGRHEAAIDLFSQAQSLRTRLHGADHPRNAAYLVNKASAQLSLNDYQGARSSARAGLDVVANGGVQSRSTIALLHANYAIASWLDGQRIEDSAIRAAADQVTALAQAYTDEHWIVSGLRIALLGLEVDGSGDRDTIARTELCRRLTSERPLLTSEAGRLPLMNAKLDEALAKKGVCDNLN